MKRIKAIGFDMDHTLVRYNTEAFEKLTHEKTLLKLVEAKNYPEEILKLKFDFKLSIEGLVIDKKRGHLLKISRFGKVKEASHGLEKLSYYDMQNLYSNRVIDISLDHFQSLDTSFSISNGVLFSQLVELKKGLQEIPSFDTLADDIRECIDGVHRDGTLKDAVRSDIENFIIQDPKLVERLEKYKRFGKRLLIITNSDYPYCQLLLDYTITPFLKEHPTWRELFEIVITHAKKPDFFTKDAPYLVIDPETGSMKNYGSAIQAGVYQGGFAGKLQKDLGLNGEEVLYLGDHIFGDVVSIKKTFNWRTALVLNPLEHEVESVKKSQPVQEEIDKLMLQKSHFERELNDLDEKNFDKKTSTVQEEIDQLQEKIETLNTEISGLLKKYRSYFNHTWGEMMRAGNEESRFADQVEKYACLYMPTTSDLLKWNPNTYFRPLKRILPHEIQGFY